MKAARLVILTLGLAIAFSGARPLLKRILADTKPSVQLNIASTTPRAVEESTQQSIVRDYSAAWQGLNNALANNSTGPLAENFTGYALDKLMERVKEQTQNGLKTRIVDHGHKVDAVFYSPDGSAIELKDTATLETQVLDGDTVIHSDQSQVRYYAIMTGAEDRWKVRVLENTQ
jgi:hypothetical protein